MLYLVSTPLGNLDDISKRAIDTLLSSDVILCEDTRHSQVLLSHYNIKKPLKSYHKFNEKKELETILDLLKKGQTIALISDAGTPCIQDPGSLLVKACREQNIPVRAIPGPNALIMAVSLSGEEEGPFQFIGFFQKKEESLKKELLHALSYEGHTLAYVSPHQILDVLDKLHSLAPMRKILAFKELTKHYETHYAGTAFEIKEILTLSSLKGEFVLMIKKEEEVEPFLDLSLKDHILKLQEAFSLSTNEAIKLAAKQRGLSKREVYAAIVKENYD